MTITIIGDTVSRVISWSANDNSGAVIGQGTGTSMANGVQLARAALMSYSAGQAGTYTAMSTNPGIS